jgi:alkylation response protein AidB-like acyl-CoA dehydrogenase
MFAEVFFEDVRVPVAIARCRGQGWDVTKDASPTERSSIADAGAEARLEGIATSRAGAGARRRDRRPTIRQRIARMETQVEAMA